MLSRLCLSHVLRRLHLSAFLQAQVPSIVCSHTMSSAAMSHSKAEDEDPNLKKIFRISPLVSELLAKEAANVLHDGGVLAIPTDTVYGLAADAQNNESIRRIYEIKGRDFNKPIAICLSRISQLYDWAHVTVSEQLLFDFLPGAVTLVFKRKSVLNPSLNPNTDLIGIRIPRHDFVGQLTAAHGGPIALTSANPSATPSTLTVHEFRSLWHLLDGIFDGGNISEEPNENADRSGSTVIDLSQEGYFRIIRSGTAYDESIHLLKEKYFLQERLEA